MLYDELFFLDTWHFSVGIGLTSISVGSTENNCTFLQVYHTILHCSDEYSNACFHVSPIKRNFNCLNIVVKMYTKLPDFSSELS